MNLSKAQQWALTSALAGGSLSTLKDLILNRKTKSWSKILRDALITSSITGGLGYLTNKGISNYLYNSMKDIPFGYNQKALKIALKPKGENLWEKVKDIASRVTSTPDLESIGKGLKAEDLKPYAELTGDKHDAIGLIHDLYNNPAALGPDGVREAVRAYTRSLPYRRELLARNLGIFDDSKGSLFKEIDTEDVKGNLKGLFKNFDKVLMPKDVNKFKFTFRPRPNYGDEIFSPLSNQLPIGLNDKPIIIHHPTLGRASMIYDKDSQNVAIGDIWDFKPNKSNKDKIYNSSSLTDKIRNLYSIMFENPVPVYTEANIKDIL